MERRSRRERLGSDRSRIILYLLAHGATEDQRFAPRAALREEISVELVIDSGELTRQLQGLAEEKLVSYESRRVLREEGQEHGTKTLHRKKKVPLLTAAGIMEARRTQNRLLQARLDLPEEGRPLVSDFLRQVPTVRPYAILRFTRSHLEDHEEVLTLNREEWLRYLGTDLMKYLLRLFGVQTPADLDPLHNFVTLLSIFAAADEPILAIQFLRSTSELDKGVLDTLHDGAALAKRPGLRQISEIVNTESFETALDMIPLRTTLEIEITSDLKRLTFHLGGIDLPIRDPVLLWECSCKLPQPFAGPNARTECHIHSHSNGSAIADAFGRVNVINYDNVKVLWTFDKTYWPPAIDSLFFAKTLAEEGYGGLELDRVLDLGCGTGFLGIFLATKNPKIRKVVFSDIYSLPVFCAKLNWDLNRLGRSHRASFVFNSNGFRGLRGERFDLVLCNPPYLPHLGHPELAKVNAVMGTALLEEAIVAGSSYADELLIGCSSIALEEFKNAVAAARETGSLRSSQSIGFLRVPFRVQHVFEHPAYLRDLLSYARGPQDLSSDTNRYLVLNEDSPFRIWHDIYLYSLKFGN